MAAIEWTNTANAVASRLNALSYRDFGLKLKRLGPPSAFQQQGAALLAALQTAGGNYDDGSNDAATTPYALAVQSWTAVAEPAWEDLDAINRAAIAQYGSTPPAPTALASSVATSTSPVTLRPNGGGLDGDAEGTTFAIPSCVSVTTKSSPTSGSFNTGGSHAIVVSGTDVNGNSISSSLVLYRTGGGETAVTSAAFATVTQIAIPAQVDGQGTFMFGLFGAATPAQLACFGIPAAAAALTPWQPVTTYGPGAIISPTTSAGAFYYVCGAPGASDSSAPIWPQTLDAEVADGGTLWTAAFPVGGPTPAALPFDSTLPSFPIMGVRSAAAANLAAAVGDPALQASIDAAFLAWVRVTDARPTPPGAGSPFVVDQDILSDNLAASLNAALANAQAWMRRSPP